MGFARVLMLLLVVCLIGCGPSETTKKVEPPAAQDQIKMALQNVAETGEIDSGLMVVSDKLEEMKATDAAKAEELLKDLADLEKSSGEAAKKKATEMVAATPAEARSQNPQSSATTAAYSPCSQRPDAHLPSDR